MSKAAIKLLICSVLFCAGLLSFPFVADAVYPLARAVVASPSFGEYRLYNGLMIGHEGVDLKAGYGEPVHPVAPGKILIFSSPASNSAGYRAGYGRYVVVDHGGYQTIYGHLSLIPQKIISGETVYVDTSTTIGWTGSSGNSTGPHLHFGIAPSNVDALSSGAHFQLNPLTNLYLKIDQPLDLVGFSEIVDRPTSAFPSSAYIRVFEKGTDSAWHESNFQNLNKALRIVVEAYQRKDRASPPTNPYKIEFKIERLSGGRMTVVEKVIQFDDISSYANPPKSPTYPVSKNYSFEKPIVSKPMGAKNYFYLDWTPSTAGIYSVTVKAYSCYVENGQVKLTDPEPGVSWFGRTLTVGLNYIDFTDPSYGYAWNPNTGVGVAAAALTGIKTGEAGISAAGTMIGLGPEIFYTDVSDTYLSPRPDDPDFQNYTNIIARSRTPGNWEISIIDNRFGTTYETISQQNTDLMNVRWNAAYAPGAYSYLVKATDPSSGNSSVAHGVADIVVDTGKPGFNIYPLVAPTLVNFTGEAVTFQFSPNEDLYSTVINVIYLPTGAKQIEGLAVDPQLRRNDIMSVRWDDASYCANGVYAFEIVMTDLAGNITIYRTNTITVNIPGNDMPPPPPPPPPGPELPPPGKERMSGVAVDKDNNVFGSYIAESSVVKFDPSGKIILSSVESFNNSKLNVPIGLAYSKCNDKLIVADSYNNRLLVISTSGEGVSKTEGAGTSQIYEYIEKHDEILWGAVTFNYRTEKISKDYKGFCLPNYLSINNNNNHVFVLDSLNRRILKFGLNGDGKLSPVEFDQYVDIEKLLKKDISIEKEKFDSLSMWDTFWDYGDTVSLTTGGLAILDAWLAGAAIPGWGWVLVVISGILPSSHVDDISFKTNWIGTEYFSEPGNSENLFFNIPSGLAVDGFDNIYASDTARSKIFKFKPDGAFDKVLTYPGSEAFRSRNPCGLFIDDYGILYVADTGNKLVKEFSPDGIFLRSYGASGITPMPLGLAVKRIDDRKTFFIADGTKNNIQIFTGQTPPTDFWLTSTAEVWTASRENRIKWTTPEAWTGLKKFQIYGKKGSAESWVMLANDISPTSAEASFTFLDDGDYDIKVRAVAKEGSWRETDGGTSDLEPGYPARLLRVVCDTTPPNVFAIIEPSNGSYLTSRKPLIKWNKAEDIHLDRYLVEIATGEADFGSGALFTSGTLESDAATWETPSDLSGGTYFITVSAFDSLGNRRDAFSKFSIDNTPPAITNVAVSHKYFSPLISKTDEIKFTVTDDATTELKNYSVRILDKVGSIIADIASGESVSAGTYSALWDGGVPDGTYFLKIEARDLADNIASYSDQIIVDTISPEASDVSAFPILFSPNNDSFDDAAKIQFKVSEPCTAYIYIRDKNGETIKTAQLNYLSSAETSEFVWDGFTDAKELIQGEYSFSIRLKDLAGNGSENYVSNSVSLDLTPYLIAVTASPEVMSQIIPQPKPIVFYYSVSKQVTLEAEIYIGATKAKTLLTPSVRDLGNYTLNWNGKNDSGNNVTEGIYGYEFTARAPDKTVVKKGEIRIDNTAPVVSGVKIDPDTVKLGQPADLTYHLSERAWVNIDLLDDYGSAVSTPINSQFQEAGDHSVNIQSSGLSAGQEYNIRIMAEDEAGNVCVISPVKLAVISGLSLLDVYEDPSPFSPNGDGLNDLARIHYKIAGGIGDIKLTLKIMNLAGGTVKTIRNDDVAFLGSSIDYWDGSGDTGLLPGDGEYTYRIEIRDGQGNFAAQEGPVILVRNPDVTVYVDPSSFSPNGDGFQDQAIIHYGLNYSNLLTGESLVQIKIYDQTGNEVHSFSQSYTQGSYTHAWDGRNEQGSYVPNGSYRIDVLVRDPVGTIVANSVNVMVSTSGPSIAVSGPSPATFTPNGDGINDETFIGYSVSSEGAAGPITVSIYNSETIFDSSTLVKRLTGSASGGTVWDGTVDAPGGNGDADGNGFADKGLYKVVIEAADGAGNKTSAVGDTPIAVEKILLNIENLSESGNPSPRIISPNGDSVNDKASIKFRLSTSPEPTPPAYAKAMTKAVKVQEVPYYVGKVTIKIKDASGDLIKTVMNNVPCYKDTVYDISNGSLWDGMDSATGKAAEDGAYKVEITATDMIADQAQNSLISGITSNFDSIVIDNTHPEVAIDSPISGAILGRTLTIEGVANDVNFGSYLIEYGEGGLPSTWTKIGTDEASPVNGGILGYWDTSGKNGDYTIRITAVDAAGNTSTGQKTVSIDNIPPTAIIESPAGNSLHRDSVVISGTAADNIPAHFDSYSVYYASGESAAGGWGLLGENTNPAMSSTLEVLNTSALNDGKYTLRLVSQDKAGNQSESKINISTDNTPPVANIMTPASNSWVRSSFNIVGDAYDANPLSHTIEYSVHGQNSWVQIASGNGDVHNNTLANWNTAGFNNDYDIRLRVTDAVGHTAEATLVTYHVDNTPPVILINSVRPKPFNQLNGTVSVECNISDAAPNVSIEAKISTLIDDDVRSIRGYLDGPVPNGTVSFEWNGLNNGGDYVNEGVYRFNIRAKDLAGNESLFTISTVEARDDVRLTVNSADSENPAIAVNGNSIHVVWKDKRDGNYEIYYKMSGDGGKTWSTDRNLSNNGDIDTLPKIAVAGNIVHVIWQNGVYSTNNNGSMIYIRSINNGSTWQAPICLSPYPLNSRPNIIAEGTTAYCIYSISALFKGPDGGDWLKVGLLIRKSDDSGSSWSTGTSFVAGVATPGNFPPGPQIYFSSICKSGNNLYISYIVDFLGTRKLFFIMSSDGGNSWGSGSFWDINWDPLTADSGPGIIKANNNILILWPDKRSGYYSIYSKMSANEGATWSADAPFISMGGNSPAVSIASLTPNINLIWDNNIEGNDEIYIKNSADGGSSWSSNIRLTYNNSPSKIPGIAVDNNSNADAVWQDNRDGNWEIYFQKIPYNFAPLKGSVTASMLTAKPIDIQQLIIQTIYLTSECISPKGGARVQTLRPEFKWYGLKGVMDYKIECAKVSDEAALANTMDYFNATISYDHAQADRPIGKFTIPEHQIGLDESTTADPFWYWRIKAISGESVATSEMASFSIQLPISISGVVNYPNPFNPNREKTKIRYKLGREADEVTIRIYDITGALVKELEGTTNSEGASVWDKYNDVEWDGRNGRGDVVRNGVYPFEISVSVNGKRVSARGKIAVLK